MDDGREADHLRRIDLHIKIERAAGLVASFRDGIDYYRDRLDRYHTRLGHIDALLGEPEPEELT
jgi:hypothetical protein